MALHLEVLFHLHDQLDALDFIGPLEMLSHAQNPDGSPIFHSTIAAAHEMTTSKQGARFARDIDSASAHARLATFDIFIVPGGAAPPVLASHAEPLALIRAFQDLPVGQRKSPRTLLSVCTGSLFLAEQGVLAGLTATTHWGSMHLLRSITAGGTTEVVARRFVVNAVDARTGLRVITSGGVSCGLDASLWLVEMVAGKEVRERVERMTEYRYRGDEGLIVGL